MAAAMMLCACATFEGVGTTSAVRTTAILDTSRPYYLEPCRADPAQMEYRLIPAAGLRAWRDDKVPFAVPLAGSAAERTKLHADTALAREKCLLRAQIKNGQPLAIRLNSVAMGGLATYDATGKCTKVCERDIAVVLDINGSPTLQEPIIAYYQRGVRSDGVLSFQDQTIFTQEQWFVRNPPNIRVRLYDVHDDKDRILRDRLEMIGRGVNQVKDYIAGASVAGPVVNAAILAAEQLISGPRNKLILSMEFQLYPNLDEAAKPPEGAPGEEQPGPPDAAEVARRERALIEKTEARALTPTEMEDLREKLGEQRNVPKKQAGFTPAIQDRIREKFPQLKDERNDSPTMRKAARFLIKRVEPEMENTGGGDAAFGAFLFALPYVVFNEGAQGFQTACDPNYLLKKPLAPGLRQQELPPFYFMPAGRYYGGARIHSKARAADTNTCALDTPHVLFTITRDTGAVSLDVAKRISELRTKFAANSGISADLIDDLSGTLVDAQLARRIDTLENTRRVYDLISLIDTLGAQLKDAVAAGAERKPMPKETQRGRAYRLIGAYTGCSITDAVDLDGLKALSAELGQLDNAERGPRATTPYFKLKNGGVFKCPKLGDQVTKPVTPAPEPTPTPTPTATVAPDQPVVQVFPPDSPAPKPGEIQVQDPNKPAPTAPENPGIVVGKPEETP